MRFKAFGGWKCDRGRTKLHARILRGKGVQKKKPNMFNVGSSTSATFVLPVRHGTCVAVQTKDGDRHVMWSNDQAEAGAKISR